MLRSACNSPADGCQLQTMDIVSLQVAVAFAQHKDQPTVCCTFTHEQLRASFNLHIGGKAELQLSYSRGHNGIVLQRTCVWPQEPGAKNPDIVHLPVYCVHFEMTGLCLPRV